MLVIEKTKTVSLEILQARYPLARVTEDKDFYYVTWSQKRLG